MYADTKHRVRRPVEPHTGRGEAGDNDHGVLGHKAVLAHFPAELAIQHRLRGKHLVHRVVQKRVDVLLADLLQSRLQGVGERRDLMVSVSNVSAIPMAEYL